MNKRNDTRREVLLDVRDEPITSIDALVEQCHRAAECTAVDDLLLV